MKSTTPIYHLKRKAKALARMENIPLHAALDRMAGTQGYGSWSLLAARHAAASPATSLYESLCAGDLLLIGARPGLGKTLLALQLAVEAMKAGHRAHVFTLEYTEEQLAERFARIGADIARLKSLLTTDCSDTISAEHITSRLRQAAPGTLVVVDYLQLLDQRRSTPPLDQQVAMLKSFARTRGLVMVFVSQIRRNYDPQVKAFPTLDDIRLPNPMALSAFDKTCFLNDSGVRFEAAS